MTVEDPSDTTIRPADTGARSDGPGGTTQPAGDAVDAADEGKAAKPPSPTVGQRITGDLETPSPAVKATPVVIPAGATAGEVFRLSLDSCFEQLAANEALFVAGRNPDNLHQTRVSWRRARAAFSLFGPLLDEEALDLKVRMREIVLPLGPARDADVLLARAIKQGWPYRAQRTLRGRRRRAYSVAIPLLRSPQWLEMKRDLRDWLERPDWLAGVAGLRDAPAREVTDKALEKRFTRVARAGAGLLTMTDHELHAVRIEGKKFRYGCEFFADLYADAPGDPPAAYASAMSAMQDAFGAANDHAAAAGILASHGIRADLLGEQKRTRSECVTAWADVMELTPFWRGPDEDAAGTATGGSGDQSA